MTRGLRTLCITLLITIYLVRYGTNVKLYFDSPAVVPEPGVVSSPVSPVEAAVAPANSEAGSGAEADAPADVEQMNRERAAREKEVFIKGKNRKEPNQAGTPV